MRRTAVFLALALSALCAAAAPASKESIEEILVLTNTEKVIDQMYAGLEQNIRAGMMQALRNRPMTPEQRAVIDRAPAAMASALRDEFNWATMKPEYVKIYQDTFDQEEVDGLLAFYKSPAGKALIAKTPIVLEKSMALGQSRMQTFLPRIEASMETIMRDLLKEIPRKN